MDLLSQLRDIHAAPLVPWWPPAPGWWLLAAAVLVACAFGLRRGWRGWRDHVRRRELFRWLDALEANVDPAALPQEFLSSINRLFKAVAIRAFGEQACARMEGAAWVAFVRQHLAASPDADCLGVLADGPYRPAPRFDAAALGRLAREWVRQYG